MSKPWVYYDTDRTASMDFRPSILHQCACGSTMWRLVVEFEDYEISGYMLDMECLECGSLAIAPTPIDNPEGDY